MIFNVDVQDVTDLLEALGDAISADDADHESEELAARRARWDELTDMLAGRLDPKPMALVHPEGEPAGVPWRDLFCPHCKRRASLVDVDAAVCGHEMDEVTLNPYARQANRKPYVGHISYKHDDFHTSHYECSECGGAVALPADVEIDAG